MSQIIILLKFITFHLIVSKTTVGKIVYKNGILLSYNRSSVGLLRDGNVFLVAGA